MGIEVEASIPISTSNPAAGNGDQRLRAFLGGGVQEGTQFQAPAAPPNDFHIESDHDALGTQIEAERGLLNHQITALGGATIPQMNAHRVGNVEYVTHPAGPVPAFDVETNPGLTAFRNCVTAMAADIQNRHTQATNLTMTPVAGGVYNVGVPPLGDWGTFQAANGLNPADVTNARNRILARVSPILYVQATVGVLLNKISSFLRRAGGKANLTGGIQSPTTNAARLLTRNAADVASGALSQVQGLPRVVRRSGTLKGYLSVLVSYIFGNYVARNQNVDKNVAAFFSKRKLNKVQRELSVNKRPDQWAAPQRNQLIQNIQNGVDTRLQRPDTIYYWNQYNDNNGPLGDWRNVWLPGVLSGAADNFTGVQVAGRQIQPTDHPRGRTITPGPGRANRGAVGAQQHSGVLPLEYRHIATHPTAAGLLALANEIAADLRRANR
jgi:hypothetical protein